MRKVIWIFNHYATNMFEDKAGRHYWFAQNLIKQGYEPVIFCASTIHNSEKEIFLDSNKYCVKNNNGIKFIFIKTPSYHGNGKKRIINMISFYKNLIKVAKSIAKKTSKPDIILASSVHPLTLVAGIKLSKKFKISCISEVRDLWPESLVAYGLLKRNSFIATILYRGERWIYEKSDSIVMTWEGGREYIKQKGWENKVDLKKVYHISNGIDIEQFDKNKEKYQLKDKDLDNNKFKNFIYTGSIRKVNNLGLLIDAAKIISQSDNKNIRVLIYGDGDERESLEKRCVEENIDNVIFKGKVEKKYIPYILSKSYINILHNTSTLLDQYGQSQNKLFEYLASGKGILQTYATSFNVITKYNCGLVVQQQNAENIAEYILNLAENTCQYEIISENARKFAYNHDFKLLTDKLIKIIENE